jgi:hypothetical protein
MTLNRTTTLTLLLLAALAVAVIVLVTGSPDLAVEAAGRRPG